MAERIEDEDDLSTTAGPANESNVPPVKRDPATTATGAVVGVSGRKGGAAPAALYEDYSQARAYDMTRNLSEPSGVSRWLPILAALAILLGILWLASRYLAFPNQINNPVYPTATAYPNAYPNGAVR